MCTMGIYKADLKICVGTQWVIIWKLVIKTQFAFCKSLYSHLQSNTLHRLAVIVMQEDQGLQNKKLFNYLQLICPNLSYTLFWAAASRRRASRISSGLWIDKGTCIRCDCIQKTPYIRESADHVWHTPYIYGADEEPMGHNWLDRSLEYRVSLSLPIFQALLYLFIHLRV